MSATGKGGVKERVGRRVERRKVRPTRWNETRARCEECHVVRVFGKTSPQTEDDNHAG